MSSYGPNRYLCSVLEEMRSQLKLLDTNNIERYRSITAMMIEEVQTLGERMESSLGDTKDVEELMIKRARLKKEVRELKLKILELKPEESDD